MSPMNKEDVKVIKASYRLQQKVGAGPLDAKAVQQSQNVIDTNEVDFGPLGLSILKKLADALDVARTSTATTKDVKQMMTTPVMELKAHAAIFHYTLIGNLANIMLNFLEAIVAVDADALDIVKAHHDSLHMIIVRGMKGNGGEGGKILTSELQQACDRYYNKKFGK